MIWYDMNHNTVFIVWWCWRDGHQTSQLGDYLLILLYPLEESKDIAKTFRFSFLSKCKYVLVWIISCYIISDHIVDLKWENHLKVGIHKPKLKVNMQSVSDDNIQKKFLKSHILSWLQKVYSNWKHIASSGRAFQVFWPATGKARLPTVNRLTSGTRRRLVHVEWSVHLPGRLCSVTSGPRYGSPLSWRTLIVAKAILYIQVNLDSGRQQNV